MSSSVIGDSIRKQKIVYTYTTEEKTELWNSYYLNQLTIPGLAQEGAVVAQLASARLSEREVPGSILGDLNVCFDFTLIRVARALNTRKTEH